MNQFQAAGGPGFVIRELLDAGFMHADVATVAEGGLRAYGACRCRRAPRCAGARCRRRAATSVLRGAAALQRRRRAKLLTGNLGAR